MGFLDEVDSLRAKGGLSAPSMPLVIGLGVVAVVVALVAGYFALGSVFQPGIVVELGDQTGMSQDGAEEGQDAESAETFLYVHVTGAVTKPGLYEMPQGSRVKDAVDAAGGFSKDAQQESVNLARQLSDGEQVVVASKSAAAPSPSSASSSPSTSAKGGKVNINSANAEQLMEIDGIGEATAAKIIAYREEKGPFKSIEDIKDVSGIGDKKFESMKDSITV